MSGNNLDTYDISSAIMNNKQVINIYVLYYSDFSVLSLLR